MNKVHFRSSLHCAKMEDPIENWISQLEMDEEETFNQSQSHINTFDEEEFLREILQEPEFSPEIQSPFPSTIQNNPVAAIVEGFSTGGVNSPSNSSLSFDETTFDGNETLHISNNTNSIMSLEKCATSPTTCLLSFDNSSVEPIIHEPSSKHDKTLVSAKRTTGEDDCEKPRVHHETKRVRSSSRTQDHIMAERKRRSELTGFIIALSATIPGLKKMDKAYVLREAINYIKKLQEHVKELENQDKDRRVDSAILIRKSQSSANKQITYCEAKTDSGCRSIESPLEVEAKIVEKEVLIGIRCEKQKDIVLKIHVLLGKLHLSISSCSVLPFGISTLIIKIIAKMHDEYSMAMDDLVKSLREDLLESHMTCNSDTC